MKFTKVVKAYNYNNAIQEQLELLLNNAKIMFNTNSDVVRENIDEIQHPENQKKIDSIYKRLSFLNVDLEKLVEDFQELAKTEEII